MAVAYYHIVRLKPVNVGSAESYYQNIGLPDKTFGNIKTAVYVSQTIIFVAIRKTAMMHEAVKKPVIYNQLISRKLIPAQKPPYGVLNGGRIKQNAKRIVY